MGDRDRRLSLCGTHARDKCKQGDKCEQDSLRPRRGPEGNHSAGRNTGPRTACIDPVGIVTSMDAQSWKSHLYQCYVSSGQTRDGTLSAAGRPRPPRAQFRSMIRRHFPADRRTPIVDIGCGHGLLLHFLREAGYQNLRGVDTSEEQVALAERLGVPGVECGDAMGFLRTLPDESVGVACLLDVLEHLTRPEAFEMAGEIRRVLTREGRCIVHTPNAEGIFGMRIRYGDLTHEQAFTRRSIQQMFRSLGFRGVSCFEDKPVVHGIRSLVRRALWETGTLPFRLLLTAETGNPGEFILSQNFLSVAQK